VVQLLQISLYKSRRGEDDTCTASDGRTDCWQRNLRSHVHERSHLIPLGSFKLLFLGCFLVFDGLMRAEASSANLVPRSICKRLL